MEHFTFRSKYGLVFQETLYTDLNGMVFLGGEGEGRGQAYIWRQDRAYFQKNTITCMFEK